METILKDFQITLVPPETNRVSPEIERAKSPLKKRKSFLLERRSSVERNELTSSSDGIEHRKRTDTAPAPFRRINSVE